VNIDGARQGDAVDGHFLVVDTVSRQTGEQNSDQRDKTDDETQSNHWLTQKSAVGNQCKKASEVRRWWLQRESRRADGNNEAAIIYAQLQWVKTMSAGTSNLVATKGESQCAASKFVPANQGV
jgi:hypothetical protein